MAEPREITIATRFKWAQLSAAAVERVLDEDGGARRKNCHSDGCHGVDGRCRDVRCSLLHMIADDDRACFRLALATSSPAVVDHFTLYVGQVASA